MVAHLLRLRLDLLIGSFRGGSRHVVRVVVSTLLAVAGVAVAVWAILRLDSAANDVASTVTVVAGAAITAGFLVAPLLGGPDDPLDPRKFAVFGADPLTLSASVMLASLLGVPVLALIVIGVAFVALWAAHGVPIGVAVWALVMGVLTTVLLAKVAFAIGSRILRQRRSRELTGLILVGLVVIVVPVVVFLASLEWRGRVPSQLVEAGDILALTPLAAAWSLPWRWLDGDASGTIVVAVLTLVILAAVWVLLVRWLMTTTERPLSSRSQRGLGWFAVTPGTPSGAIAARSLIYWLRDPRYIVNVIVVPVMAVLTMLPLVVVGVPLSVAVLLPAPLMALFFGWLAHNDLAYDSTALWMHLASAVRGTADRLGRLVPVFLIAVPVLALAIPVTAWIHGRWMVVPALIGVCASLLLCGLGLSSISSVVAPYPVSRPGDSPFEQPQRTGGALSQGSVLLGALVLSAPALWWAWLSIDGAGDLHYGWAAFWGGLGIGAGVAIVGVLVGGWFFQRRGSALMEFAEST